MESETLTPSEKEIFADLLISMLTVNLWSLEKAFPLHDGLLREGLLDIESVSEMSPEEVFPRLERAGYRRGEFMIGLLSERILNTARTLAGNGIQELSMLIENKEIKKLDELLLGIKGIGPSVLNSFKLLRGLVNKEI